ncbi:acetyl-CoA carboxylase biotin carboxyl carrier protein [Nocardia thailandica]|uniref:acetyl-CoA carboxylase biotin carboxyl carrier protein n=1 Tax=Nocardia thailandica TaxID=257275 RepID=UPI000319E705|nr:acetyl-CoA carboxylase biotin carboxyl carrier protein subunit [Nocardia thailandica]
MTATPDTAAHARDTELTTAAGLPAEAPLDAGAAEEGLALLTRHALHLRAATEPAPTVVSVGNGPLRIRLEWPDPGAAANPAAGAVAAGVAGYLPYAPGFGAVPGHPAGPASAPAPATGADPAGAGGDGHPQAARNGSAAAPTFTLTAETVGVFYRAAEPGAAPFVAEGDPVRPGQQIGIIEAMKLMIPVTAAREGVVVAFHAGNGDAVEYGQALAEFEALR